MAVGFSDGGGGGGGTLGEGMSLKVEKGLPSI